MRSKILTCLVMLSLPLILGWAYSKHSVPLDEIKHGGPVKDGIPALMKPRFAMPGSSGTQYLKPGDRVIGVTVNKKSKAYPVKILNWHEVVNDRIGGKSVVVTYCPLCGTGMVFDAHTGKQKRTFGVSGLLYQSDMLLYDHQTESLWSQIKSEAVAGPLTGQKLSLIPSTLTSWKEWRQRQPDTIVMTQDTGYDRDYHRDPYGGYEHSGDIYFEMSRKSSMYPAKEKMIGIVLGSVEKVYPFSELKRSQLPVKDILGSASVVVNFDSSSNTATIQDGGWKNLPSVTAYWFAWFAFHPNAEVYKAGTR